MPQLYTELRPVAVTTTGSAGSAAGSGTTVELVNAGLWSVYIDYNDSAPDTTVLTISDSKGRVLWTGSAGKTDGWVYPRGGASEDQVIGIAGLRLVFALSLSDALVPAATLYPIVLD